MVNARDAIYPDEYNGPGRFFEKNISVLVNMLNIFYGIMWTNN